MSIKMFRYLFVCIFCCMMKSVGIPLSSEYTTLRGREVNIVWVDISKYLNAILKEITFLLTKLRILAFSFSYWLVEKSCRQSESQKKTQVFLCHCHSLSSFLKALNPRSLQSPWNPGAQQAQAGQTEHGLNSLRASFLKNCLLILCVMLDNDSKFQSVHHQSARDALQHTVLSSHSLGAWYINYLLV